MLHIGKNYLLKESDILGIFDIENTTNSKITRDYLTAAGRAGRVVNVSDDIPKSFVITVQKSPKNGKKDKKGSKDRKITVYLSQYSPSTIKTRKNAENGNKT